MDVPVGEPVRRIRRAELPERVPGPLRYAAGRRVVDIMHDHDLPQACPAERIEDPVGHRPDRRRSYAAAARCHRGPVADLGGLPLADPAGLLAILQPDTPPRTQPPTSAASSTAKLSRSPSRQPQSWLATHRTASRSSAGPVRRSARRAARSRTGVRPVLTTCQRWGTRGSSRRPVRGCPPLARAAGSALAGGSRPARTAQGTSARLSCWE